ncbi:amp dependent CoA ligase [Mycena floridula]|nr:amp dependent CoA ligase [Mycena floridula]
MTEFCCPTPLPPIPDDLTVPQFIFETPLPQGFPWLIEDAPGDLPFRILHRSDVQERTKGLANGLSLKWNIAEDEVVCLFSPNDLDYPVCVWAIHRLGGIITPVNPGFTIDELVAQLTATKASAMLVHSAVLSTGIAAAEKVGLSKDRIIILRSPATKSGHLAVEDVVSFGLREPLNYRERRLRPGEGRTKLAFLNFSSGTTGKPKAVCLSHFNLIANVVQTAAHWQVRDTNDPYKRMEPGGIAACVLPFFHIYGLVVEMHFMIIAGISILVMPKFSYEEYLKSLVRYRVTHLFLVPPQVLLLVKHSATNKYDLSGIKCITSGAAPLSGELLLQLAKITPNASIGQGYGLTEAGGVCLPRPDRTLAKVGSSGVLLPGVVLKVVKPDGSLAVEGEEGELFVKTPSNALGYFDDESATRESFVDDWFRTGDVGMVKNQEIYVTDRLKELIKVRGFQVAPAELEAHCLLLASVADVCVVGIPDDYSGELPLAFVVLEAGVKEKIGKDPSLEKSVKDEIYQHVANSKVKYKWLTGGIQFIDVIPKNPSGKLLRRLLRDRARTSRKVHARL